MGMSGVTLTGEGGRRVIQREREEGEINKV